jgi:hypothetical protein
MRKWVDGGRLEVRKDGHADAPRGLPALLHRDQDKCSSAPLELPAPAEASLDAADPGIVDLDLTPKRFARDIDHRSAELVKDHPGRFVAPKPKLVLEEECRNTPLVGGHHVGCPQPKGQRDLGIVKHRPRGQRNLIAAGGTLPASSSHQRVAASLGTSRTLVTFGPAARGQVPLAGLLVGELELKLAECFWEGRARHLPILQIEVT